MRSTRATNKLSVASESDNIKATNRQISNTKSVSASIKLKNNINVSVRASNLRKLEKKDVGNQNTKVKKGLVFRDSTNIAKIFKASVCIGKDICIEEKQNMKIQSPENLKANKNDEISKISSVQKNRGLPKRTLHLRNSSKNESVYTTNLRPRRSKTESNNEAKLKTANKRSRQSNKETKNNIEAKISKKSKTKTENAFENETKEDNFEINSSMPMNKKTRQTNNATTALSLSPSASSLKEQTDQRNKKEKIDQNYKKEKCANTSPPSKRTRQSNAKGKARDLLIDLPRKFFKLNNGIKKEVKLPEKTQHQNNKRRKCQPRDSSFKISTDPAATLENESKKQLRPRVAKNSAQNYCEDSKILDENTANNTDKKSIPVYKTLNLENDDKNKDADKIYDFDFPSDEESQKGVQKRKKTVRKASSKVKKAGTKRATSKAPRSQKNLVAHKKDIVSEKKVEFVENMVESGKKDKVFQTADLSIHSENKTEHQTSKKSHPEIKSIEKLEGKNKICVAQTPSKLKTNKKSKLINPENIPASKQDNQYTKMVNHSLITQSMSPITRLESAAIDIDTPQKLKAHDAFSRVKEVVQSTPQHSRFQERNEFNGFPRPDESEMILHQEHSIQNNDKMENIQNITPMNSPSKSPRKFGTVLSNENSLSPVKQASPSKNNANFGMTYCDSMASTIMIQPPRPDLSIMDDQTTVLNPVQNKENTLPSPKKSPRRKLRLGSPIKSRKSSQFSQSEENVNFPDIEDNIQCTEVTEPFPLISTLNKESCTKDLNFEKNKVFNRNKDKNNVSVSEDPDSLAGLLEMQKRLYNQSKVPPAKKQTNLHKFLNLKEMPEKTCIRTPHGIFDDMHSTPAKGKELPPKNFENLGLENAFGFDEFDETFSPISKIPGEGVTTLKDVVDSKKGKLFPNARVKSVAPARISVGDLKVLKESREFQKIDKKKLKELHMKNNEINDNKSKQLKLFSNERNNNENKNTNCDKSDSDCDHEEENNDKRNVSNKILYEPKQKLIDAVSFSDTFDYIDKPEDIVKSLPEEVPLFVDLEPTHFSEPPRRSYGKRKRPVQTEVHREDSDDCIDDHDDSGSESNKKKKKKRSKKQKTAQDKRVEEWVKNMNKTFNEVDNFELVVE